jgi:hypothetical protein
MPYTFTGKAALSSGEGTITLDDAYLGSIIGLVVDDRSSFL